jgi:homoserine kinase
MQTDESLRLKVPASTSNLGSGFDTLSAALGLYLTLDVARIPGEEIRWIADWEIKPEENMIKTALERACEELGTKPTGLKITVDNQIPLKRGLGSSAAAIIAGIKIAERVSGKVLDPDAIFELAYPLEGHPDNLSASLMGGWVISRVAGSAMKAERLSANLQCRFVLAVPEISVSTHTAREILPAQLDLSDAVFNLQRCALLVHALTTGDSDLLREATQDRLHQSYRASLVPGAVTLLERQGLPETLADCVLSLTVSGSGSSMLAIADGHYEEIGDWMISVFRKEGVKARFLLLDLDQTGARSF